MSIFSLSYLFVSHLFCTFDRVNQNSSNMSNTVFVAAAAAPPPPPNMM